jgi:hypothetical protein
MHHSFDVGLATKYGIEEAIIIHHFQHWIGINQRLKRNFHDGKTWTYQTLDEIAAHFPYLSRSKVFNIIEKLCLGKDRQSKKKELDFEPILVKGNFNKSTYDRTVWYAFSQEPVVILQNCNMDIGELQNGDCQIATPIPDTIPDTETKLYCPAAPRWEKIEKVDCQGKKFSLRVDDIYTLAVQKRADWTAEEIEEIWKILAKYEAPIRDLFLFCEGTIEKLRIKKSLKEMKENGEKCTNQSNLHQKKKTKEELKPKKEETKQVENINVSTSEKGTKMPLLATFALEMGLTRS